MRGDSKDAEAVDASSKGGSYSTQAFILPFDVIVPDLFPTEATTNTANFVTWETGNEGEPAGFPSDRFLPQEEQAGS